MPAARTGKKRTLSHPQCVAGQCRCGTPLFYERDRSRHIVNIPRALFEGRVGREPRYHAGLKEMPDWAYLGEALSPLKGFPGIMIERKRKKTRETSP